MKIETFALRKKQAHKLWKEYTQACKDNPKDNFLLDMKKVYNQLKSGRKVIDIYKVFEISGLNKKYEPKIAIAKAELKEIFLRVKSSANGFSRVSFQQKDPSRYDGYTIPSDIVVSSDLQIFPTIPEQLSDKGWRGEYINEITRKTIIPKIPASLRPKGSLENYYVLWEVKKWTPMPPKDPYLLRRITRNMFVIVAGWELTELERAVMKGRVY